MRLKQFSLHNIFIRWRSVIERFPLAILGALIGTGIAIRLIHVDEVGDLPNILLTLSLAVPIFVSIVLMDAAQGWTRRKKTIINTAAIVFLAAYFYLLPGIEEGESVYYIRHVMWTLGFVLLITFIPFLLKRGKEVIALFWQYSRILFFSLVVTIIWAWALYAGIAIALLSIDFLFNVSINGDRYAELFVVVAGIFVPSFFLNRLPIEPHIFKKKRGYPKEVRLFSQFVLVPLVSVYFFILYAYSIKIILSGDWPEGQVAYMILGFSLLGIVTYFALYPLRESVKWIRKSGDLLFVAMIPQVLMLYRALWFRVSEYGITENRYFVFVFGCWLLIMAVYYLGSKERDIRLIPATVFLIAFLSSVGPWGAFQVSERSQIHRLEQILVENTLLVEGKIQTLGDDQSIPQEDVGEINAIIRYLDSTHGLMGIESWFEEDAFLEGRWTCQEDCGQGDSLKYYVITELIGVDYSYNRWSDENLGSRFSIESEDYLLGGLTQDYEYWRSFSIVADTIVIDGEEFRAGVRDSGAELWIQSGEDMLIEVSLQPFLEELLGDKQNRTLPSSELTFEFENERISGVLFIRNVSGNQSSELGYELSSLQGMLLFSPKDRE